MAMYSEPQFESDPCLGHCSAKVNLSLFPLYVLKWVPQSETIDWGCKKEQTDDGAVFHVTTTRNKPKIQHNHSEAISHADTYPNNIHFRNHGNHTS